MYACDYMLIPTYIIMFYVETADFYICSKEINLLNPVNLVLHNMASLYIAYVRIYHCQVAITLL